jgi:molecular chaperone DnaJ
MARNYYEVLGVRSNADQEAIKRAYRRRSRELHPDAAGGSESSDRFHELAEAYRVLSREDSRRLYDRFGWRGRGRGFDRRRGGVYASRRGEVLDDLENLFAAAAGREPDREPARVVGEIELDAYEAQVGATKPVDLQEPRACEACGGTGGEVVDCAGCGGTGRRRRISNTAEGRLLQLHQCESCGGGGRVPVSECETCGGHGLTQDGELQVPVPPGVRHLDRVRIGPDEVAVVRIVPPRERLLVRTAAIAALIVALGFLLFLLAL